MKFEIGLTILSDWEETQEYPTSINLSKVIASGENDA